MTKGPYFAERKEGGWTFQCPHEEFSDVFVITIDNGEMVICPRCAREASLQYVKYADTNIMRRLRRTKMQTAVVFVKFDDDCTEEYAQALFSEFYLAHRDIINGMKVSFLDTEQTYEKVQTLCYSFLENPKERTQSKLTELP